MGRTAPAGAEKRCQGQGWEWRSDTTAGQQAEQVEWVPVAAGDLALFSWLPLWAEASGESCQSLAGFLAPTNWPAGSFAQSSRSLLAQSSCEIKLKQC